MRPTIAHRRRAVSGNPDIAVRLRGLRVQLLAEYDQCTAELRSKSDDDDAAERACDCAADVLRHLLAEIRGVETALERLHAGQYGVCIDCGRPIRTSRLRAIPTACRCMRCQIGVERKAG